MRSLRYASLIAISLLAITILTPAPRAGAQGSNSVLVGIYVLNVGRFDLASGSYTIDFYLSMRCATAKCNLGSFEFMNGRSSSIRLEENSSTEKFWRVEANLYQNVDLHNYPFDSHTITIQIEDTTLTTRNLTYTPDSSNSGVDPSVVVVGWGISGWSQGVVDHYYQAFNQTYSRYVFSLKLERRTASGIELFIPVFFLVFIALVAMLMYGKTSSVLENRILLTASVLVAAVLYQFTLDSSMPPLGYLTFADKFMVATYAIIVSALVIGISVLRCHHKHDLARSERIHSYSIRLMPFASLILLGIVFWLFLQ